MHQVTVLETEQDWNIDGKSDWQKWYFDPLNIALQWSWATLKGQLNYRTLYRVRQNKVAP